MPSKKKHDEIANLIKMLSEDDLRIIRKDYPFKKTRNDKIVQLMQQGLSCYVLAGLTGGLSKSSIHRIGRHGVNQYSKQALKATDDLNKIKIIVSEFNQKINNILMHRRK